MLRTRKWGKADPPAQRRMFIGSVLNRISDGALAVAWLMPEIVLMFRITGTVHVMQPVDFLPWTGPAASTQGC